MGIGNKKFGIIEKNNEYCLKLDKIITNKIKIPSSHKNTFSLNDFNKQSSRISFNKNGKLILNITYSYIKPIKLDNKIKSKGMIGIDIGPKELAVCYVKNDGNPILYKHYNIGGLLDSSSNNRRRLIGNILDEIIKKGKELGISKISIEDLENLKIKKTYNKSLNRMLSKFPTLLFKELIKGKCSKNGMKLKEISPSYTSIIGLYKYSKRDNLSTAHHSRSKDLSAALVIGRRGLGLKEREVVCFRELGRTIALTANSLYFSAEHEKNKKGNSKKVSNFWHKISKDENLKKSLTGILKIK